MRKYILVLGLGKTGFSIAKHLQNQGFDFIVYDTRLHPPLLHQFIQRFAHIEVYCHDYPANLMDRVEKIICSPGIALHEEILQEALQKGVLIENDLDCLMPLVRAPIIGITGSNGKSTVTTLVAQMCQMAGLKTAAGGNLGTPVLDLWAEQPDADIWVLELSSFQLLHMQSLKLKAAALLNISPDHLDYHGSMTAYVQAKQRIFQDTEMLIYNRDDLQTFPQIECVHQESFGLSQPNDFQWGLEQTAEGLVIAYEKKPLIAVSDLKITGLHNYINIMAAASLARYVGISDECIVRVLKQFCGLEHRTQWVAKHNGVIYINDSKATNIGASYAAIEGIGPTLTGQIVLIAGGQGKGADFHSMCELLKKYVSCVILIGHDAPLLEKQWQDAVKIVHATQMREAVLFASQVAKPNDMVLLSPACASLDMFENYEDRGHQFMNAVKGLVSC